MLKKIILLGIFVGGCASLPYFHELNPGALERWVAAAQSDEVEVTDAGEASAGAKAPKPMRVAAIEEPESQPQTQPLLGRKVLVRADGRGHFVAEFRMNGRKLDALVDTGATMVALNRTTARQIGISLTSADFKYKVSTANGLTKAASAVIGRIQVGRITLENIEALVLEDRALDGVLIGMTFLKRLSKFEMRDGALVMQQ